MEFAREQAREGHLLTARAAYEKTIADAVMAEIREAGDLEGLSRVFEEKKGRRDGLHRGLDFVREIAGRGSLSPEQKGELYWRIRRGVLNLAPKDPDRSSASARSFLAHLKRTLATFEKHKDSSDPEKVHEAEEEPIF